jgi:hypothetical protein
VRLPSPLQRKCGDGVNEKKGNEEEKEEKNRKYRNGFEAWY